MKLGVFVGSFNPPHLGHLHAIKYILNNKIVDKILIVPTPNYWDKQDLIDVKERIEMLKFYEDENIEVDTTHNNYTYTYEILDSLKEEYKNDELYLIIGSDNLEKFHEWKRIDEILKNKVIVLNRGKIIKNKYLSEYDNMFIYLNDFNYLDISSTEIRNGNYRMLDDRVLKYIKNNNLYK